MKSLIFYLLVRLFRLVNLITKSPFYIGFYNFLARAYWKAQLGRQGYKTAIFRNVIIHLPKSVVIGDRCVIGEFVHIWGGGGVTIGNNVLIASHVVITSMTHETAAQHIRDTLIKRPVIIEDNVWIGAGAIILPGVRLGTGCIVGAGAVVTKDVCADWIVAGIPAREVRLRMPNESKI